MKRYLTKIFFVLWGFCLSFLVQAAEISVTTTNDTVSDDGHCSLREAITASYNNTASGVTDGECSAGSTGADTIILVDGATYTLSGSSGENNNASGDLDIRGEVGITVNGGGTATIDGDGVDRVIEIQLNATVSFENITIQNGRVENSGTVYAAGIKLGSATNLTLTNCTIQNNSTVTTSGTALGSGLYVSGSSNVEILNTTIKDNTVDATDFFAYGAGIYVVGTVEMKNTTISGNTSYSANSSGYGGGLFAASSAHVKISSSTISDNTTDSVLSNYGGGIYAHSSATISVKSSIMANNVATGVVGDEDSDCYGTLDTYGYNLLLNTDGCSLDTTTSGVDSSLDITEVNPLLNDLTDNGGFVQTHAICSSGPAYGSGSCTDIDGDAVNTDARGESRDSHCDIGAFELVATDDDGCTEDLSGGEEELNVDWGDCNHYANCEESLSADTTQESGFELYDYDSESDHFIYFLDSTSSEVPSITTEEFNIVKDSLECGYKLYVCEMGLAVPSSEKLHVYIGDTSTSGGSQGYITVNDNYFNSALVTYKLLVAPPHELFHVIQSKYFYNSSENFTEGQAVYAEQIISSDHFSTSIDDYNRAYALSQTFFHATYSLNVFYRFLFEQLAGLPSDLGDISPFYAAEYLKKMLLALHYADSSITFSKFVEEFVSDNASCESVVSDAEALIQNYITMQYAFRYVDVETYPQYSLFNKDDFADVTSFSFYSEDNVIQSGSPVTFSNQSVEYFSGYGYGFSYTLNAEYHELETDGSETSFLFTKDDGDEYMGFQVIIRDTNNNITVHQLFEENDFAVVDLGDTSNIADIVFAAYTTYDNPSSGDGRTYEATVYAGSDDYDGDGIVNGSDNCPLDVNVDRTDQNGNGVGAACEDDDMTVPTQEEDDTCTEEVSGSELESESEDSSSTFPSATIVNDGTSSGTSDDHAASGSDGNSVDNGSTEGSYGNDNSPSGGSCHLITGKIQARHSILELAFFICLNILVLIRLQGRQTHGKL